MSNYPIPDITHIKHEQEINKFTESLLINYNKITKLPNNQLEKILKINEETVNSIKNFKIRRITTKPYKILKLYFGDTYSYGPNNMIDFMNMKDIICLKAGNASGKSSLLNNIRFAIHGQCDNVTAPINVLSSFSSGKLFTSIDIQQEDNIFRIVRAHKSSFQNPETIFDKTKSTIRMSAELLILNKETNKFERYDNKLADHYLDDTITDLFGDPSNLSNIFFMLQKEHKSHFLNMETNTETYNYFSNYYNLDIFDKLTSKADAKLKYLETYLSKNKNNIENNENIKNKQKYESLLSEYENDKILKQQIEQDIINIRDDITRLKTTIETLQINKELINNDDIQQQINDEQDYCNEIYNQIAENGNNVKILLDNIPILEQKYQTNNNSLKKILNKKITKKPIPTKEQKEMEAKLGNINNELLEIEKKIYHCSEQNIFLKEKQEINYQDIKKLITNKKNQDTYDQIIKEHNINKYINMINKNDNTINTCINKKNILQKERDKISNTLELYKINNTIKTYLKDKIEKLINDNVNILKTMDDYDIEINKINDIQNELKEELLETEELIKIYKNTQIYNDSIKLYEDKTNTLNIKIIENDNLTKKISKTLNEINIYKNKLDNYNKALQEYNENNKEYHDYKLYKDMICRDAIPKYILSHELPKIEKIMNDIIKIFCNMQITFKIESGTNTQRKADLSPHIKIFSVGQNSHNMCMASGFESFIINWSLRIALKNLLNINGPFIAIDEHLSTCDTTKINSVLQNFFNYLKDNFEMAIIMSHVDDIIKQTSTIINIIKLDDKHSYIENNINQMEKIKKDMKEIYDSSVGKYWPQFIEDKKINSEENKKINNEEMKKFIKITTKTESQKNDEIITMCKTNKGNTKCILNVDLYKQRKANNAIEDKKEDIKQDIKQESIKEDKVLKKRGRKTKPTINIQTKQEPKIEELEKDIKEPTIYTKNTTNKQNSITMKNNKLKIFINTKQ